MIFKNNRDLREDLSIFLFECPHQRFISMKEEELCKGCNGWLVGRWVGDLVVTVDDNGSIKAKAFGDIGD